MTNEILISLLSFQIDGQEPSTAMAYDLQEITVETSLHLPSVATLIFHDPELALLDSAQLEPGKTLVVKGKTSSGSPSTVFDGEIVEVEGALGMEGNSVIVRAFDRMHRLARGSHTRVFKQVSDADMLGTCAKDAGLSADAAATSGQHDYYIQANESNLSLLRRRAAARGYLLYANGAKLCFKPPSSSITVALEWNKTLAEFRPRLSSVDYVAKAAVRGWDPVTKQPVVGEARNSKLSPQVGVQPKNFFSIQPSERVSNLAIQNQEEARTVAQALVDSRASRFIEAEGVAFGEPKLQAGVTVSITGVGTRFSGNYFVTSATHRLRAGEPFTTEFNVTGLNPSLVLGMLAPPEQEHRPLGGLTIGIVTDNKDPEHLGRVRVKFPLLYDDGNGQEIESNWVRMASIAAGGNRGLLFLPEVNDEVLVGFGQGDINVPFVLGALWNGRDKAPGNKNKMIGGNGVVDHRVIYSRSGHYILLDDSEADGGISLVDKNGNKLILKAQDNSLTIKTQGNIAVTTDGNLSLEAAGNLSLEAAGNLSLKANGNLKAEAMGQAEVKGSAGAKVESPAILDLKGSMINLN